jgi:hypothetical protein
MNPFLFCHVFCLHCGVLVSYYSTKQATLSRTRISNSFQDGWRKIDSDPKQFHVGTTDVSLLCLVQDTSATEGICSLDWSSIVTPVRCGYRGLVPRRTNWPSVLKELRLRSHKRTYCKSDLRLKIWVYVPEDGLSQKTGWRTVSCRVTWTLDSES